MGKLEQRGRLIYLVVAVLLTVWILSGLSQAVLGDWNEIKWWKSVLFPTAFVAAVIGLWTGNETLHWCVATICAVRGAVSLFAGVRIFAAFRRAGLTTESEPEQILYGSAIMVAFIGIAYLTVGALLWFLPSVNRFFAYQRGDRSKLERPGPVDHPNLWQN